MVSAKRLIKPNSPSSESSVLFSDISIESIESAKIVF
jgi:hypothetical protein